MRRRGQTEQLNGSSFARTLEAMRLRWLVLAVGLSSFFFTTFSARPAEATVARAMAMRELVTEADVIARVTVLSHRARLDSLDRIVTDVTLRIDEPLYGATGAGPVRAGDEIVVTRLGGVLDGVGLRVEGEPGFVRGSEQLVFLSERAGLLRPTGMSQGVFPIVRDAAGHELAMPNGAGLALVAPGGPALTPASPALVSPRAVDVLLDEVRALIGEVHGG